MTGSLAPPERNGGIHRKTKVKTGCATCRIRKVKCDESKPHCHRCVDTGRNCDGYQSPFRLFTGQPMRATQASGTKPATISRVEWPSLPEIKSEDINLLSRCFSTKSIFDVDLGCDEEAKQVLQASLNDPAIQHAMSSLKALRCDYETAGDVSASVAQPTSSHDYGLQQYCMALGGLASNLSSPSPKGLKSALLCCQIFISIEQVRGHYVTMAQHITQGLTIMHQYSARPSLDASGSLVSACHDEVPLLDVLLIKLFAVPCKFSERLAPETTTETAVLALSAPSQKPTTESRRPRGIAPNMRTELSRIASSTLEFLDKVANVSLTANALQLLPLKASLLNSLEMWLIDLELIQTPGHEQLSLSFMRLFHQVMKAVLVGALDSSPDVHAKLRAENDRMQTIARTVEAGVKACKACSETNWVV